MALDPNIALGVQPLRIENPMNQLGQLLQVQNAQRQNELGSLQLQQAQDERTSTQALNSAYQGALKPDGTVDRSRLFNALATQNLGSKIPALQKTFMESDKAAEEIARARAGTAKDLQAVADKGFMAWRNTMASLRGLPGVTPDLVNAKITELINAGVLNSDAGQKMMAATPTDPQALLSAIDQASRAELTPEQRFTLFAPKPAQVDNGQQIGFRDTNPLSQTYGQMTAGGAIQKQATPGDVLQATTSTENNKRSVEAQLANAAATREVAKATRDAASIAANAKSETDIRKEFADLPETKKYKNAIPAFSSLVNAAKTNNPQADINLIYGLAKLYDPDSVVREGEYGTIANSQAIPEWLKGQAQRLIGGGRLTEATKKQIIEQAQIRIDSYKGEYEASRGAFEDIIRKRGLDPANVLTPVGTSMPKTPSASRLTPAEEAELAALKKRFGK